MEAQVLTDSGCPKKECRPDSVNTGALVEEFECVSEMIPFFSFRMIVLGCR